MSSYSSITPRNNRRMTLSTLPPNSVQRPVAADPAQKLKNEMAAKNSGNMRLPPKGRQSMIPRVGRENLNAPNTPGSRSGTSTATPSVAASSSSFHSTTNRRRSVGGSDSNSSVPSMRRQSMIPPSNGGSGSSVSSVGQKADPRPINDRAYQHQCMKDLLAFLQEMGYEYPISIKTLSRPSAKDFTNMTTFLLRLIDKDFQRGGMKFEDEVSLNFKCLGYPYPISKTALVAAGTPHTWPSLLAALTWLMHQLQCKSADVQRNELENETMKDFSSIMDLETQTDKAFFQYMGQAYSAFMKGDAEVLEALETAFMQRFERDDAFLAQAVERVTDLNASIVERINEIAQRCEEYVLIFYLSCI
jgi:kinetochore protein NDC80